MMTGWWFFLAGLVRWGEEEEAGVWVPLGLAVSTVVAVGEVDGWEAARDDVGARRRPAVGRRLRRSPAQLPVPLVVVVVGVAAVRP